MNARFCSEAPPELQPVNFNSFSFQCNSSFLSFPFLPLVSVNCVAECDWRRPLALRAGKCHRITKCMCTNSHTDYSLIDNSPENWQLSFFVFSAHLFTVSLTLLQPPFLYFLLFSLPLMSNGNFFFLLLLFSNLNQLSSSSFFPLFSFSSPLHFIQSPNYCFQFITAKFFVVLLSFLSLPFFTGRQMHSAANVSICMQGTAMPVQLQSPSSLSLYCSSLQLISCIE